MPALLKQWPWSTSVICSFSLLFIIAWGGLSFYLWCLFSFSSIYSLVLLIPLLVYIFYFRRVNKMISTLKGCISAQNGEVEEGYVCLHGKCSPGITIMRDNLFILIPVNGQRTKVFFEKITVVNETKSMALKCLGAKRLFQVEVGQNRSVSFSVKDSVAKRWSVLLASRLAQ